MRHIYLKSIAGCLAWEHSWLFLLRLTQKLTVYFTGTLKAFAKQISKAVSDLSRAFGPSLRLIYDSVCFRCECSEDSEHIWKCVGGYPSVNSTMSDGTLEHKPQRQFQP